jgi:hypothetical protein
VDNVSNVDRVPSLRSGCEHEQYNQQLGLVSEQARKLLVHIVDTLHGGRVPERAEDTTYAPELLESTGLSVEVFIALVEELRKARLLEVKGDFPFEDLKLPHDSPIKTLYDQHHASGAFRSMIVQGKLAEGKNA